MLLSFSLPATASIFAELLTSLTDTLFAGHLGAQSTPALAAMALASPIIGIFIAIQSLFALPIGILVARHSSNPEKGNAIFALATIMCTMAAIAESAALLLSIDWLLPSMGARGECRSLLENYLAIQSFSNVLSAVGFSFATGIRALGFPFAETLITIGSVALDIALNALFAFGLNMGFMGLAYGTLVSEAACAASCTIFLAVKKALPPLKGIRTITVKRQILSIMEVGLAQSGAQMLTGVTAGMLNAEMAAFGTEHLAAWSIAQRFYSLALAPLAGLSQGLQTTLAMNDGLGKTEKSQQVTRIALVLAISTGAVAGACAFLGGNAICGAFGAEESLSNPAKTSLSISCAALPLLGACQILVSLLIVRNRPKSALGICLCKNAAAMFAATAFGSSPELIASCIPLSDSMAFIVAAMLAKRKPLPGDK